MCLSTPLSAKLVGVFFKTSSVLSLLELEVHINQGSELPMGSFFCGWASVEGNLNASMYRYILDNSMFPTVPGPV